MTPVCIRVVAATIYTSRVGISLPFSVLFPLSNELQGFVLDFFSEKKSPIGIVDQKIASVLKFLLPALATMFIIPHSFPGAPPMKHLITLSVIDITLRYILENTNLLNRMIPHQEAHGTN